MSPGKESVHLGLLDDMDHEAKWDTDAEYRKTELRIQALGAAISRRYWHAVEQAHAAIRDKFYAHSVPVALENKPTLSSEDRDIIAAISRKYQGDHNIETLLSILRWCLTTMESKYGR